MYAGGMGLLSFPARYAALARARRSILCVGLDPTPDCVPPSFGSGTDVKAVKDYLFKVVEVAAPRVAVVKPQYAFYGKMGPEGIRLLIDLVAHAHEQGLEVILDAKRADIGNTMEAYGDEVFGQYNVDACTFVPYLGETFYPAWMPHLAKGRCAISMVRTSNPEAVTIQDVVLEDRSLIPGLLETDPDTGEPEKARLYLYLATLVNQWHAQVAAETGGLGSVGGVVGATWPTEAIRCRALMGDDTFALIPGYGAQGGGSEGAAKAVPASNGDILGTDNSSRGITHQSWYDKTKGQPKPGDPLDHVMAAIDSANADLRQAFIALVGGDPFSEAP